MATLADLTCDSDGKVDRFINPAVRGGGVVKYARPVFELWRPGF